MATTKTTSGVRTIGTDEVLPANIMDNNKGADIASGTTVIVGTDGMYQDITGTTGPIGTYTVAAGRQFIHQFDAAATVTHSATIALYGAVDFVAAAGDRVTFFAVAANTVVEVGRTTVAVAAAGGWVDVVAYEASTSATVDFTSDITDAYKSYRFTGTGLTLNAGGGIECLASINAGSSWHTDYDYISRRLNAAAFSGTKQQTVAAIRLDQNMENATGNFFGFEFQIENPANATKDKAFKSWMSVNDTAEGGAVKCVGLIRTTSAINGIRFDAAGGAATIIGGTITMAGHA